MKRALGLVFFLWSSPAAAAAVGGPEIEIRFTHSPIDLSGTHFSAVGVDSLGYVREVSAYGRDVGLGRHDFWIADFAFGARVGSPRWQFHIAAILGAGYGSSGAGPGPAFDASSVWIARMGVELGGGLVLGPVFIRADGVAILGSAEIKLGSSLAPLTTQYTYASVGWLGPRLAVSVALPWRLMVGASILENLLDVAGTELTLGAGVRF
jgi:hypothetical protein